jgi:methionyl-tRNA formyltransferase
MAAPAVKVAATALGVEVYQPQRVRDGSLEQWLKDHQVEVAVVMAYGRILPEAVLRAPRFGCVNLHASLLPKYRGAAPINWCLYHGELETGVSLMQMDAGLDTGPVYAMQRLAIDSAWNAGDLSQALAALAAQSVELDLPRVFRGEVPVPQDHAQASHAPPLLGPEVELDWTRSAVGLQRQVRAFAPRPASHTWLDGKRLRILAANVVPNSFGPGPGSSTSDAASPAPGCVVHAAGTQIWVTTGAGLLGIERAQLEGKRELDARDLVNGRTLQRDQKFHKAPERQKNTTPAQMQVRGASKPCSRNRAPQSYCKHLNSNSRAFVFRTRRKVRWPTPFIGCFSG